jgi:flagellar M-ring protein FliF
LQRFGIGRLATILGVAAGVAAVLVAVMLRVGEKPDNLLYSNLDPREASEVTQALSQANIEYDASGDGTTIRVGRDDVGRARMMLASRGLVTSGSVGYEIFDNQSVLGQTEFQQNLNEKRALEGELARTLLSMRGINSARVHLALPARQLFSAEAVAPTAAVVVGLAGRELTGDQVAAIRNVVASAVPNLKPEHVTLTDEANRTLAAGNESGGFSGAQAADRKAQTEAEMTDRIRNLVEGVVGPGNARVQVTADIETARQTIQQQEFNPDGQVVRSTSTGEQTSESRDAADAGAVTATANIPEGNAPAVAAGGGAGTRSGDTSETTNYEISNTTTTTVREPGQVKKLSVAVAVDGVRAPGANGAFTPRSAEDIQRIDALVKAAIGFDQARGDQVKVEPVRFERSTAEAAGTEVKPSLLDLDKNDIMRIVELAILFLVGVLLVFFVLRPLLKSASGPGGPLQMALSPVEAAQAMTGGQQMLPAGGGQLALAGPSEMDQRLDIARIEGQVKASSVKKVSDFVERHPDESTAILRNWVHET